MENFSNLEKYNSCCKWGLYCMGGDLIVRSQSHKQLAG